MVSLSPPKPTSIACISAPGGTGLPRPGVETKKSATRGARPSPGSDEGEASGARPGQRALGHPGGERRGDAGVDGVPALFEHTRAGLCGQRVTRCDGALH